MVDYIDFSKSPYTAQFSSLQTYTNPEQEIRLFVDTSGGAVVINLLPASTYPTENMKVFVTDVSGNAGTNNITVNAYSGDKINGADSILCANARGNLKLEISSSRDWWASSAGGDAFPLLTYDVTIQPTRIIQLLNDPTDQEIIVQSPPVGYFAEPWHCNWYMINGSTVYNGGTGPSGGSSLGLTAVQLTGNNDSNSFYSTGKAFLIVNGSKDTIIRGVRNNGLRAYSNAFQGFSIRGNTNYGATQGDCPIRVYGYYSIKKLT